jgi:DNA-binding transcriptional LysR family regulator
MELRHLEHFVACAEEGHFNRAAARCHIVRSGVSASIRALEKELGTQLFLRTTREVRLTPAGVAFLAEARRVLASVEAARNAVDGVSGLVRGTLRVAVSHANRAADLPALMVAFHSAHPDVALSVTAGVWRAILADIRTGAVDVGLAYLPTELPSDTNVEVLATGSMVFVCRCDHPFSDRAEVALRELRDEAIISVPASSVRRTAIDEALEAAGVVRRVRIDVARLGFVVSTVRAGLGVGIMPGPDAGGPSAELFRRGDIEARARDGRAPVCYVPISEPSPRWSYAVVCAPPGIRTPVATAFLRLLQQERAGSAKHPTEAALAAQLGG